MSKRLTLLLPKLFLLLLPAGFKVQAQDTSYVQQPPARVLDSLSDNQRLDASADSRLTQPLLPHKMLFTQRIFWGPSGLLRTSGIAPLTAEGRQKEQKVRHIMLVAHQVTGYATLVGFVMQGILAAKLTHTTGSEHSRLLNAQQTTVALTNITYGTTALLSLTAPPTIRTNRNGRTSGVKLHKYLSIIHLTGFVATNVLARKAINHAEVKPYHQAAAFTTLAAFAPALIALKF